MLPKPLRLKDKSLFQKAFRGGKSFFFGNITCKALFTGDGYAHVGLSISKKVFPRAVDRNAVKRVFARVVRGFYKDIPDGWQVVFSFKGTNIPNDDEIRDGVEATIQKIRTIKTKNI